MLFKNEPFSFSNGQFTTFQMSDYQDRLATSNCLPVLKRSAFVIQRLLKTSNTGEGRRACILSFRLISRLFQIASQPKFLAAGIVFLSFTSKALLEVTETLNEHVHVSDH